MDIVNIMLKRTPNDIKQRKIAALKAQLAETDYKAIKYAEGLISEAEYAPTKAERETIRAKIRALEE
jgi:hypothetical protein